VVILALVLAVLRRPVAGPGPSVSAAGSPHPTLGGSVDPAGDRGYLVSHSELRDRAARAAAGQEPEASAVRDLLDWAATAVAQPAHPEEPLRIDGTTGPFVDDTAAAYGLALAWGVSGDQRYAAAARDIVMAWVATTQSLENACPDTGDCQTSLIVSRTAPGFIFAMDLLGPSHVVSDADDTAFLAWLRSVILPSASTRTNNWGDAGALLRVTATDALGDAAGFDAGIAQWRSQLDLVASDGHIPEEVRRGSSGLSYTQEALMYKIAVARIAERRGIELWSAVGHDGGTLKTAVEYAARYQLNPAGWPWIKNVDVPTAGPMWELAYAEWPEPIFADILRPVRPLGADGHSAVRWTTLTNGLPLPSG
jgi:Alginate lyase